MRKEKYEPLELEIVAIRTTDVILASYDIDYEDDELPFMPVH